MTDAPSPTAPAAWRPDPSLDGRLRYWDGQRWTNHVSQGGEQYEEVFLGEGEVRWQYGVVDIGVFTALAKMQVVLGAAGETGWQLVTIYDKGSAWIQGVENGFMLFKRPVPAGVRLADHEWCIALDLASAVVPKAKAGTASPAAPAPGFAPPALG